MRMTGDGARRLAWAFSLAKFSVAMPRDLGANTHKPGCTPGAMAYAGKGAGSSGECPFNSTTSSRIWISSGSPSPSTSFSFSTVFGVSRVCINVCIEILFVPLTKAATSAGLSGSHTDDSSMLTPSIVWRLRQSGCLSRQNGSTSTGSM